MLTMVQGLQRRFLGGDPVLTRVMRGSALVMLIQVAGLALGYSMQVAIARLAGPFEFGVFAYAWTWMNLILLFGAFGMNELVLRLLPTRISEGRWGEVRGLVLRGPLVVLGLGAVCGLLACALLLALGDAVGEHYRRPLLWTFAATPLFGLMALYLGLGRAQGSVLTAFLPRSIGLPLLVLLVTVGLAAVAGAPSAAELVAASVAIATLLVVVQAVLLVRGMPAEAQGVAAESPAGAWLKASMPFLFIAVCFSLLTYCDMLLVGFFLSATDVAVYQAASRTAALVSFPLFAMNALVAPMIARRWADRQLPELERSVAVVTRLVFWPSLVGGLVAVVAGRQILGLFGPEFEAGHAVLGVLVLGHLVNVASGPVTYMMTMTGDQNRCALAWAGTVAAQALLGVVLIPAFGLVGAAVATTIATCTLALVLGLMVKQRLDIAVHAFVPVWQSLARAIRR